MRSDDKAMFEHLCAEARAIMARVKASRLALGDLIEKSQEALAGSRQTLREADEALAGLGFTDAAGGGSANRL